MLEKQGDRKILEYLWSQQLGQQLVARPVITKTPAIMSAFCNKVSFSQNAEIQDIPTSDWSFTIPSCGITVV